MIVLLAIERAREPLELRLLTTVNDVMATSRNGNPPRISVLGVYSTQPLAAMAMNHVRDAGTILRAREILGIVHPREHVAAA